MQDELAEQLSAHGSHSHRAISSRPGSCPPGEENHRGCSGAVEPSRRGVFPDAVAVLGM